MSIHNPITTGILRTSDSITVSVASPLDAQWTRIGGGFTVSPSLQRVDVEQLILASATAAPSDARLFWVMASWIARHFKLINMRRMGRVLDEVDDAFTSAVVGAAIDVALLMEGNLKPLVTLRGHCRALETPRVLFDVVRENRFLAKLAEDECHPVFAAWGLWQRDVTDKRDAIRPVSWVLRHCPEFRLRSLLGADLEAAIMDSVSLAPATISDLARRTGATRAAVHEAVENLAARGLMKKPTEGYRKVLSVPPNIVEWLAHFPVG